MFSFKLKKERLFGKNVCVVFQFITVGTQAFKALGRAMASKTKDFFESGNSAQFEWVLGLYDQVLRLKAESKSSKPDNVIKLDKW